MTMKRRDFLATGAAVMAAPAIVRAEGVRTLRFIPQADLSILDPHFNTAYVTRNHGYMVYDTLYGLNGRYQASGQMVDGHTVEDDGKRWTLTLREGMRWHDGEPVLARDCVASIRRWGAKDTFGQTLLAATDELSAIDGRRLVFRLKRPFPLLPDALAKSGVYMPAMMPERLAKTDPGTQVTEIVGSGPFRWKADERVPGARAVWERFDGYVPRPGGAPDYTSGPKIAYLDRVVWTTVPDPATASAALQANETDWWEYASADLLPLLRRNDRLITRGAGSGRAGRAAAHELAATALRQSRDPPRGAERRGAVGLPDGDARRRSQALARRNRGVHPRHAARQRRRHDGADRPPRRRPAQARPDRGGLQGRAGRADRADRLPEPQGAVRRGRRHAAPHRHERRLPGDGLGAPSLTRRAKMDPVSAGGWSLFFTFSAGTDMATPAAQLMMRGTGKAAWFGWPTDPRLEQLRDAWFAAPGLEEQKAIARDIQLRVFETVPFVPLGQYFQTTAYRKTVTGVLDGFATFWNVRLDA